jgi:hypothetical protein
MAMMKRRQRRSFMQKNRHGTEDEMTGYHVQYRGDVDGQASVPPMIFADDFVEHVNIGWRVEPAVPDPHNPLLEPAFPWDSASPCVGHGTVLRDPLDGRYKAWVAAASDPPAYTRGQHEFRLAYACSDDGVHWQRPELDLCPFPGHPRSNILLDFSSGGRTTYASVLIDPDTDPGEPYEMFAFRDLFRCQSGQVAGFEGPGKADSHGLCRYRSSDGIHWRGVQGPTDMETGDTLYVHRDVDGAYLCHHKNSVPAFPGGYVPYDVAAGQCRISLQRRSPDGAEWTPSVPVLMPDWKDHPGDQIMELGYYPYDTGVIGITAIYHATAQTMDLQFAASVDGRTWWRPSRQPCLPLAPLGDYGGGMIWPTRTLVADGDDLHLYYGACDGLHGDLYGRTDNCLRPFSGAFCRATWKAGRMWAAVPAAGGALEAALTTPPLDCGGMALCLNALTQDQGQVTAEVLDLEHRAVPGFTRQDAVPFSGDQDHALCRWRGGDRIALERGHLRLHLERARLYGYRLVSA